MSPRLLAGRLSLYTLGLSAIWLAGCGAEGLEDDLGNGPADRIAQRQQAIVGGETDREHTAVLAIATITREAQGLCTGTLVAPNLVLTARHCVVPTESQVVDCGESTFAAPHPAANLWVTPSTEVRGSSLFPVREVAVPSDDGALCGSDIALLILDGQFSARIPPLAPRLDDPAARGESFTAVGFGSALEEGAAGTRRGIDGLEVVCGPEDCQAPELLTRTEFVGEQAVCDGDSGGPALDSNGEIVGVASRTGEGCGWAVYSAVSPWRDWIIEVATRADTLGEYERPAWLASALIADSSLERVPEDAVVALPASPERDSEEPGSSPGAPGGIGDGPATLARGESGCSVASAGGAGDPRRVALGALALSLFGLLRRRSRA